MRAATSRSRAARLELHASSARGAELGAIELPVPGRHNVLNSLAAVAVGLDLGVAFEHIAAGARRLHAASTGASRCAARRAA